MRLLLVDLGRGWRGGQRQAALLAAGLAARGHDVAVAAPAGSPLVDAVQAGGIATVPVAARFDLDPIAAAVVARASHRFDADVVHTHDARAHGVARLARPLGRRGALVVARRVMRPPRGRWKYGRDAAAYIGVSNAVRRSLEDAGIPPHRVRVVPDGVPPAPHGERTEQVHTRLGIDPDRPIVIAVGALTPEKDPATLVAAAAHLEREGVRCAWVLLGAGPLETHVRGLVAGTGAPVYLGGFVSEPGPWIRAASVCAHAAREEGLGSALLDAMARAVPIVAARAGGVPEVVSEDAGLLVPPGEPEALAAAVARILRDERLRVRLAQGARERACAFSVDRMVEGTLAVYGSVRGGAR